MTVFGRRFLAAGAVVLCLSLVLSLKTLYYPGLLMLLLVMGSGLLIEVNHRSVYAMFFTSSRKLTRGDAVVVEYMLTNRSILPIFFIDVQIEFAKEMGLQDLQGIKGEEDENKQLFFAPFRIMTFKRAARCPHRGFYKVGNMSVVMRDPMGFFERRLRFEKAVNITVLPKVQVITSNPMPPLDTDGLLQTRSQFNEDRTSIRSIRPYVEDDSVQHVHWKASARMGKPFVKTYQVSAQDTLLLMVNGALSDYEIEGVDRRLLDEETVERAIAYGRFYMSQGVKVNIVFCGKRKMEVGFSGLENMDLVLEEAAAYELDRNLDFVQTVESEMLKRFAGTRMLLITPDRNQRYKELLDQLRAQTFRVQLIDSLKAPMERIL